jgi:hypothetical protein
VPTKTTPDDCPCSSGSCQLCEATGLIRFSAPLGLDEIRSTSSKRSLLQWTNNTGVASAGLVAGNGWSLTGVPKLVLRQSDYLGPRSIALPINGTDVRTFERSTSDCNLFIRSVSGGATDVLRLVGSGASAEIHYKGSDGSTIRFGGLGTTVAAGRRGQYLGESDAAGNRVEASLNANGSISELRGYPSDSAVSDLVQRFTYSGATTSNPGRLSEMRVERADGSLLRRTQLTHYSTTTSVGGVVIGRAGDLREMVVRDGAGGVLERSAFRYSTDSRGRSVLAYVLDDDSQRRLAAAGLDRNTASNSQLAPYAKDFFAYDSQNRVIRHDQQGAGCTVCTGGIGTSSFDYFTRTGGGTGFNSCRIAPPKPARMETRRSPTATPPARRCSRCSGCWWIPPTPPWWASNGARSPPTTPQRASRRCRPRPRACSCPPTWRRWRPTTTCRTRWRATTNT